MRVVTSCHCAHLPSCSPEVSMLMVHQGTEVIHDMPHSLQWIQDTPVQNTGYSNRLDPQRTKSCKPSTNMMVHNGHTRTSNSRTPIMCQTWHCGTQLCSQPPEEEVGAAEGSHNRMWKRSTKIFKTQNLHPLNTKDDLFKAYLDRVEELAVSQEHITSPYAVMQNPLYMHHGSAQLLCSHWCEKN